MELIALIILVTLVVGSRRVDVARCISPEEGIEDIELTEAYDRISKWPQFRFLRKLIVRELRRCHPQGVLADIGCGPGYLMADISKSFSQIFLITHTAIPQEIDTSKIIVDKDLSTGISRARFEKPTIAI